MNESPTQPFPSGIGPILIVFLAWAAIIGLSLNAYRPVQPLTVDAPADQFSATRATKILKTLVGDSIPHPAGSPQNAIVRQRIVSLLESYGYEVEIQTGTGQVWARAKHRSPDRDQIELHNIIARLKGTRSGPAIMLTAHYDSVPSGPGASDDGVGTAAVLEIARMLAAEPAPERDIVFLITDGEEFGLLGADLFVAENPLAKEIGLAINLEARGTTGPSLMFETSPLSRRLIPVFAASAQKPLASSLFFEIYKRLPNDTDFTIFNRAGMLGYNFAFIGDVKNYHTTEDNYESVDPGSLQHHGENALDLIRELLASPEMNELLSQRSSAAEAVETASDEAVYFDLFGQWIIWWPSGWSIWICGVAAVLFLIASPQFKQVNFVETNSRPQSRFVGFAIHFAAQILVILLISLVGYLLQYLVGRDARLSLPWPQQPVPILIGYWSASLAIVGGLSIAFAKWLNPKSAWISLCVLWLALAVASSLQLNGASYLFVVPITAATTFALIACWFGEKGLLATIIATAIAAGAIWLPMERLFYDAVGLGMPIATLIRMSLLGTTLLGVLSIGNNRTRFVFSVLAAVVSVGAFVSAIALTSEV